MSRKPSTPTAKKKTSRGKIIILVAPSGSGKTTLAKRLFLEFPDLKFSVSATTRPPREHEVHAKDYYFVSAKAFDEAVKNDEFIEWEEFYGGTRYGTLISEVENELEKGYFILFDIDVKGALKVKARYGDDALAVFIKPPSEVALLERLRKRGTESEESLQMRLKRARMELSYADRFDRIIVNDDLERAGMELTELVASFMNETITN